MKNRTVGGSSHKDYNSARIGLYIFLVAASAVTVASGYISEPDSSENNSKTNPPTILSPDK